MASKQLDDVEIFLDYGIHLPSQTIKLTGDVDDNMYETLINGLILIENKKGKKDELTIELNSTGGDWYSGIAIHDRLQACSLPVTIKVSGSAMSMASVILQAADNRLITKHSTVMIHDGFSAVEGTPENIRNWEKHGREINKMMYKIYAEASGKTEQFWKTKCRKDFIISAEQAIKLGLADGYIE